MSERVATGNPVVLVLGIDPEKHEIPVMLRHHLVKMQKDFPLSFLAAEDIDDKTPAVLQDLILKSKYMPKPLEIKPKIITPNTSLEV